MPFISSVAAVYTDDVDARAFCFLSSTTTTTAKTMTSKKCFWEMICSRFCVRCFQLSLFDKLFFYFQNFHDLSLKVSVFYFAARKILFP